MSLIPNGVTRKVTSLYASVGGATLSIDTSYYLTSGHYDIAGEPARVAHIRERLEGWIDSCTTTYSWAALRSDVAILIATGIFNLVLINVVDRKVRIQGWSDLPGWLLTLVVITGLVTWLIYALARKVKKSVFPNVVFTFNGGQHYFDLPAHRRKSLGLPSAIALLLLIIGTVLSLVMSKH